jgi:hypothetical protein
MGGGGVQKLDSTYFEHHPPRITEPILPYLVMEYCQKKFPEDFFLREFSIASV